MKTKEELLKIYSAYLPYELQVASYITETKFIMKGISYRGSLQNEEGYDMTNIERAKPILYSMDMLTKEIEHKGERFVPSLEIGKHTITGGTYNWHRVKEENVSILNYEVVAKLLEWHFNVFGLSESEYIKKESLK